MGQIRKPFQGVWSIVRFNWHFFALSLGLSLVLLSLSSVLPGPYRLLAAVCCAFLLAVTLLSLLASWYVYDLSGLYRMDWCGACPSGGKIVNIHAGFDETSDLLKAKYPGCDLIVLDFYDPVKHTEISIRRARKACPCFPGTMHINTAEVPLPSDSADKLFLILAAHEIRGDDERIAFFRELNRAVRQAGQIVVAEHLRDLPNFLAYTIGSFHFLPRATWIETFRAASLRIAKESRINPFITTFFLQKNGTPT